MKILIYSMNFWPEPTSTGKYSGEMSEWLAQNGHSVRAICAPPYYPDWKIYSGYNWFLYRHENWNGVEIRRCPAWIPRRVTTLKRLACLAFFALTSFPTAVRSVFWRPDVVVIVEPTFFCAPAAWIVAKLSRGKSWLHIQDFEIDAALDLGMLRLGGLKPVILAMERWLFRRFDRRSTISPRMLERLNDKTRSSDGNILFPNWVDLGAITVLNRPSCFRADLGLHDNQLVALYSGNMGEKQGLETVIDAAAILKHRDDLVFVLCGTGAAHDRLKARGAGLPNIRWLPVQPMEKLNELLNLADVHLLPQRRDAADLVMPSKLTGMLASGKPILATAAPGTQIHELVQRVGRAIPPENPQAFAATLVEMLERRDEGLRQGALARQIAESELSREAILSRFAAELERLHADSKSCQPT